MTMRIIVILVICVLSINTSADEKKYYLTEGKRYSQAGIKALVGKIPFYKSYLELSVREREIFLEDYQDLPASIEPPYPAKGLAAIYQPIIDARKEVYGIVGEIFIVVSVDKTGVVTSSKVYKSPNRETTGIALYTLFNTRFKPALCAGKACPFDFPVRATFLPIDVLRRNKSIWLGRTKCAGSAGERSRCPLD